MFAEKLMNVLRNKSFFVLMVRTTSTTIHIPNHVFFGRSRDRLTAIMDPVSVSYQPEMNNPPYLESIHIFSMRASRGLA